MSSKLEHLAAGDPCTRVLRTGEVCGEPASRHRRKRVRVDRRRRKETDRPQWFLDGEGSTDRATGQHRYTLLVAVREDGLTERVSNPSGLSTRTVLEFLIRLRVEHGAQRVFGFGLTYDVTKWLEDLSEDRLYILQRPELWESRKGVFVWNYLLHMQGGALRIARRAPSSVALSKEERDAQQSKTSIQVWDIQKFYQCKFTKALVDWKIASKEEVDSIESMKERRGDFGELLAGGELTEGDVERYCTKECVLGGRLVRALMTACAGAGITLSQWHGAGSIAASLLGKRKLDVRRRLPHILVEELNEKTGKRREKYVPLPPRAFALERVETDELSDSLEDAVSRGFFGGRFESSRLGRVKGPLYSYDLKSAYPAAMVDLPCLVCGRYWYRRPGGSRLMAEIERADLALVHVRRSADAVKKGEAWGPFPWRASHGGIVFPLACDGTWVWKEEALAALRHFDGVQLVEAWLYTTDCDHRPFATMPELYRERLKLGGDRGKVLKLGLNSCYGKLAQAVGQAPYRSQIWAGCITSRTRARLLDALGAARDRWSVLEIATDSVLARVPLDGLPPAPDNGTSDLDEPLGSWSRTVEKRDVFFVRPGVSFPIGATEADLEKKRVKSRGLNARRLLSNADRIREHLQDRGWTEKLALPMPQRFWGLKSAVLRVLDHDYARGERGLCVTCKRAPGAHYRRDEKYGRWVDFKIEQSLNPFPKRRTVIAGTKRLEPWSYMNGESAPYDRGVVSKETEEARETQTIINENPDHDIVGEAFDVEAAE